MSSSPVISLYRKNRGNNVVALENNVAHLNRYLVVKVVAPSLLRASLSVRITTKKCEDIQCCREGTKHHTAPWKGIKPFSTSLWAGEAGVSAWLVERASAACRGTHCKPFGKTPAEFLVLLTSGNQEVARTSFTVQANGSIKERGTRKRYPVSDGSSQEEEERPRKYRRQEEDSSPSPPTTPPSQSDYLPRVPYNTILPYSPPVAPWITYLPYGSSMTTQATYYTSPPPTFLPWNVVPSNACAFPIQTCALSSSYTFPSPTSEPLLPPVSAEEETTHQPSSEPPFPTVSAEDEATHQPTMSEIVLESPVSSPPCEEIDDYFDFNLEQTPMDDDSEVVAPSLAHDQRFFGIENGMFGDYAFNNPNDLGSEDTPVASPPCEESGHFYHEQTPVYDDQHASEVVASSLADDQHFFGIESDMFGDYVFTNPIDPGSEDSEGSFDFLCGSTSN